MATASSRINALPDYEKIDLKKFIGMVPVILGARYEFKFKPGMGTPEEILLYQETLGFIGRIINVDLLLNAVTVVFDTGYKAEVGLHFMDLTLLDVI